MDVNQQLMKAASIDTVEEWQKCVIVLLNEMHIREDLIDEKHGGALIKSSLDEETVEVQTKATARREAREQVVGRTITVFENRILFTEEDVETTLKQHYRDEREQREAGDANVTHTLKSMKREVLARVVPRECRGKKLNTLAITQQWPGLGELLNATG